jgi:hypothetical protein
MLRKSSNIDKKQRIRRIEKIASSRRNVVEQE